MKPLSKDLKNKKLEELYSKLEDAKAYKEHAEEELECYIERISALTLKIETLENGEEDDEC